MGSGMWSDSSGSVYIEQKQQDGSWVKYDGPFNSQNEAMNKARQLRASGRFPAPPAAGAIRVK